MIANAVARGAPSPEALIRYLLEGTSSETGQEFLQALVPSAALAMDVAGVWMNGQFIENYWSTCCTPWHPASPRRWFITRRRYQNIRMKLRIKANVTGEQLRELSSLGPMFSPVYDSITRGVPIAVSAERMA